MGWLSSNKKRSFAEKLMKDIRAREEKENVDVIGKVSPKIQEKRAVEKAQAKISARGEEIREEREEKDKATVNKVNPTQGPNEKKAIAYLDGFFSIANITDEERDLIGKAKRAITTGKFQQLQRDVNKLRNATKKTPINPVVLLEQLMKIITVYPLESVKMYDNIQQTVNVKQKKELHPEIIISESFNI